MSPVVREFVEGCDEVLAIGTLMSDFNNGAFTARLDAALPSALGCTDWITRRVATCEDIDAVLQMTAGATSGTYIEILTDTYAASDLALKLHDSMRTLYQS